MKAMTGALLRRLESACDGCGSECPLECGRMAVRLVRIRVRCRHGVHRAALRRFGRWNRYALGLGGQMAGESIVVRHRGKVSRLGR